MYFLSLKCAKRKQIKWNASVHFVLKQNEPKIQDDFKEIFELLRKIADKSNAPAFFALQKQLHLIYSYF